MLTRGQLITAAVKRGAHLTNEGALSVVTGKHTGRSPYAKKIVKDEVTKNEVDWKNNQAMSEEEFREALTEAKMWLHERAEGSRSVYTQYVRAGRDPKTSVLVKIVCERPEHALFVQNMFEVVKTAGQPDLTVWSAPGFVDEPLVAMNMSSREIVIGGTRYAGEIKKSVFTYLNFIYPRAGILPMHCSINVDKENKAASTIFFGLSGTGKTTLSADPERLLLGDDEHGWGDKILFNFENGCYAKTIGLSEETEPEIYRASTQYGAILENVILTNSNPNFEDVSLTQNGRASYPLTHIPNAIEAGVHNAGPSSIVMLTCDAFGVLPAVAKLNKQEARQQFLMGYTAKVAGTEVGVTKPIATFSPCFGAPFMTLKPSVYGDLLANKIEKSGVDCWLVNTGWFGGPPGVGQRIGLDLTRNIITMINTGELASCQTIKHEPTGLTVPVSDKIPDLYTQPDLGWEDKTQYQHTLEELKCLMKENGNAT